MPSTQSKRDLVLKSSVAAGTVADLNITMEALFDGVLSSAITYEDESESSGRDDKTKYRIVFANGAGQSLGTITLKLVGDPVPADGSGVSVTKPVARFVFDPAGREGSVAMISAPAASFERIWKQNVRNASRTEVVDNVAKLDVRVIAENGARVSQTVRSADSNELVLLYEWSDAASGGLMSGSVTLTTTSVAGAGYTLGNIRVTDNDPSSGTTRRR